MGVFYVYFKIAQKNSFSQKPYLNLKFAGQTCRNLGFRITASTSRLYSILFQNPRGYHAHDKHTNGRTHDKKEKSYIGFISFAMSLYVCTA